MADSLTVAGSPQVGRRLDELVPSRSRYRADLDGLRGVAILLVVVSHVWFGRVSGGVDAFLLLAGFFVGTSILRGVASGGFLLGQHALKVGRRFLPVVVPVVATVLVLGFVVYPPSRWSDIAQQAIASTFMVENWWLATQGTAYGGADIDTTPFQHLWSLSVQAQLYLAFAMLLVLMARLLRARGWAVAPTLSATVVVLALASFCYAALSVDQSPVWGYFDTWARAWEFLLGILAGIAFVRWTLPGGWRVVLGWLGMAMLLSTMWVVDGARLFPGPAALIPLGGTLLIVAAGSTPTRWGVDAVLRASPVVATGKIAFGLYAWHWPILVFYLAVSGEDEVGFAAGLVIVGLSLALGYASWRFVETPFQRHRGRRAAIVLAAALAIVVTVPSVWLVYARSLPSPAAAVVSFDPEEYSRGLTGPGLAAVLGAAEDAPGIYEDDCIARGRTVVTCEYGDTESSRTLALVGGSHSGQWFAPLERLATEEEVRLVTYLRDECYFGEPRLDLYLSDDCDDWNTEVAERLVADAVDVVLTTATRSNVFDGRRTEWVPDGYLRSWERLSSAGIRVVVLRDTPWLDENPLDCLSEGGDGLSCGVARDSVLLDDDPISSVALPARVFPISLNEYICPDDFCPAVQWGLVVYRDDNHLTSTYASSLENPFRAQLGAATGWW